MERPSDASGEEAPWYSVDGIVTQEDQNPDRLLLGDLGQMAVHAAAFHGRRPEVLSVAARHVHGAGDGYEAEPPAPQVVSPRHAISSTAPPPPSPCQLPATEDYYLIRVPIAELQNGNHKKNCNKRLVGGGAGAWGRMSSAELRMSLHGGDQQTVAAAAANKMRLSYNMDHPDVWGFSLYLIHPNDTDLRTLFCNGDNGWANHLAFSPDSKRVQVFSADYIRVSSKPVSSKPVSNTNNALSYDKMYVVGIIASMAPASDCHPQCLRRLLCSFVICY
ncbi:hypothetical protein Taro_044763 [Colocasia esculenta]|uniref:Uncharacterized protein n=1 Tax=Colocasia esculenta TaxID=4460 RepID=A0A843X3S3_COLES|nr:hypothetical protein [Colocasia esculenta]